MRLRAATDAPDLMVNEYVGWRKIVNRAIADGWFRYEELRGPREVARYRAIQRNFRENLPKDGKVVEVPEPIEAEILKELASLGGIMQKLAATLAIRNFLAHGSAGLSPSSAGCLDRTAELINQLFQPP